VIIKRADFAKSLADKFFSKSSLLLQQIGYINKYPQLMLQLLIAAINHKQFQ
tara:strand:+ start:171 stop:326 length:156 start_codon:yes stop_codon:yes gene_type:complete